MSRNKKLFLILSALTLVALIAVGVFVIASRQADGADEVELLKLSQSGLDIKSRLPTIIAKGGSPNEKPLYGYRSINRACREGYSAVYFSVRESADGLWLVSPCDKLSSFTDGRGKISSKTYGEILKYNLKFDGESENDFEKDKVAEFEEAAKICLDHNVKIYLLIEKASESGLRKLLDFAGQEDFAYYFSIVSGDAAILEKVKAHSDQLGRVLFFEADKTNEIGAKPEEDQEFLLALDLSKGKAEDNLQTVRSLKEEGFDLMLFEAGDYDSLKLYFEEGVSLFVSDLILPS
ncbi:MAG: hypothetical protein GX345_08725 [Clostridiales bacterium]|nr:hypothetical protein [Clostridiales bacterium]